jgi:tetratricopeptide (TPR) repeat protein
LRGTLRFRQWLLAPGGTNAGTAVEAAERDLRAAIVPSNPSQGQAWSTLSALLQLRGKVAEANLAAQRAYDADAFLQDAADIVFRLYYTSLDLDREADALRWCSEGRRRFPGDWRFAHGQLALLLLPGAGVPDVERAWRLVADLERLSPPMDRAAYSPRWQMLMAGVLARAGRPDSARAVIALARARAPRAPEMDYNEAIARTLLGERERALDLLSNYLKATPQVRQYVAADPVFRALRDDRRFKAMTRAP